MTAGRATNRVDTRLKYRVWSLEHLAQPLLDYGRWRKFQAVLRKPPLVVVFQAG